MGWRRHAHRCPEVTLRVFRRIIRVTAGARIRRIGERLTQAEMGLFLCRTRGITAVTRCTQISEPVVDVPNLRAIQYRTQALRLVACDAG